MQQHKIPLQHEVDARRHNYTNHLYNISVTFFFALMPFGIFELYGMIYPFKNSLEELPCLHRWKDCEMTLSLSPYYGA